MEQAYRAVLDSKGIPYTQERGGGRNLSVEFERHPNVFAAVAAHVEDVKFGLGARHWNQVKDENGFITEAVLETALLSVLCGRGAGPRPVGAMSDNLALCETARL